MPLISEVITSLIEIQEAIGDQRVCLELVDKADIPLPYAEGLGINVSDRFPVRWIDDLHSLD